MGVTNWEIVEDPGTASGVVSISEELWPTLKVNGGDRVKVRVKRKTRYLSAVKRGSAQGNQLFVQPGTFKIAEGATPTVTVKKTSNAEVRVSLVFKTGSGLLSLLGLMLAIAGTVAQAVNSSHTTPSTGWIVIASIAQVLGLFLVFVRGLLNLTLP
jgi:formylmethanofuran dehydrogenase subunit D